jgi:hypothetical protein
LKIFLIYFQLPLSSIYQNNLSLLAGAKLILILVSCKFIFRLFLIPFSLLQNQF